mmetsp:Transcript_117065/g.338389  ORF Transcript_117065/g.338389 Transcript_117065/m.338389 type:complete len:224 (-) Transcript_117065:139-810(-)
MRPGLEVSNNKVSKRSTTSIRGWWMTTTAKTLSLRVTLRKAAMQSSASVAERPDVGSSQNRIGALAATPRAKITRRRCPPEIPRTSGPPMYVCCTSARPNSSINASVKSRAACFPECAPGCCFKRALNSMASRTRQCAGMWSSCPTEAAMRLKVVGSRGCPFTRTSPSCALLFFMANMSNKVVLPDPLGPMTATSSPDLNSPEHGSKICCVLPPGRPTEKAKP